MKPKVLSSALAAAIATVGAAAVTPNAQASILVPPTQASQSGTLANDIAVLSSATKLKSEEDIASFTQTMNPVIRKALASNAASPDFPHVKLVFSLAS